MKLETTIPFSGFYHSIHDQELDSQLEQYFSNDQGEVYQSLMQKAFDKADWSYIHSGYAKAYTEDFAAEFDLETLTFKMLVSPKYYNFETDRIIAEIDREEVCRIFDLVPTEVLQAVIKARFTSRDGFISYYPNDLAEWPECIADWDLNHVGTLIAAYVSTIEPEFDQHKEYDLIEHSAEVACHLFDDNIEGIDRLNKLCVYLRKREERAYNG